MADSLLERKDRFVCITRLWPLSDVRVLAGDRALVLEDIRLINERDNPPPNYTILAYTSDTREKGTVKRLICVKMVERQGGMKCICDIVFLYRSKRPPQFYTLIGDINGLQMCVKEGTVPALNIPSSSSSIPETQTKLYPNPLTGQTYQQLHRQPSDYSNTNTLTKKTDEREILDDIPFQINPKYLNDMRNKRNENGLSGLDSFRILSPYEIEQYFNYDFNIERSAI
jgi:ESCRT-I complex subunit MVB12